MRKLRLGILSSLTILLVLSGLASYAQVQEEPSIIWVKIFDGGSSDEARGLAIDSMDNIIVTGWSIQEMPQNYMTVKYDGSGNIVWSRTYGEGKQARSVAVDSLDNIIATGYRFDGFTDSFLTVKYDKNGNMLWDKTYGEEMQGEGVAIDSQNNVIVVGYYYVLDMESAWDIKIIKYDPNGNEIWSRTYDDLEGEHAFDVAVDSEDNILITGASYDGMTHNLLAIKYDKDGNLLWSSPYNGGYEDEGHSVAVDSMDNVIITGFTSDATYSYFLTIKYSKDGAKIWTKTYRKMSVNEGYGVTVDSEDNIVVTGWSFDGTTRDLIIVKYDKDGAQIWATSFKGSPTYGSLVEVRGYDVAVNSLDHIIVTGAIFYIVPQKLSDFLTIKLRTRTVDNEPPKIEVLSPENKTYTITSVPLTFAVNEPTSWMCYSLDDKANITITGNTTLTELSSGIHNVKVYAEDPSGNIGFSSTVYFAVSTPLLFHDVSVASVSSSLTEVYEGDLVDVTVVVQNRGNYTETFDVTIYADNIAIQTKTVSNLAPAAQDTLTFVWNTTGFSLGSFAVKAEASTVPGEENVADNVKVNGTIRIIHEVDNIPPTIEILSPESKTYTTNSVALTFTIDEPVTWMTYSLGDGKNVTITGNTTLTDLPNGTHTIKIYARDASGNVGSSGTIHFTVLIPSPLLFHDVSVASVSSSLTEVYEGDLVDVTVVVQNRGNYTETFDVTIYADNIAIQTKTVSNLAPAAQDTLTFVWNTTGFSLGSFAVKAEANAVPGETHAADNTKIGSTVNVTSKPSTSFSPLFIIAIPLAVAAAIFTFILYRRKRLV